MPEDQMYIIDFSKYNIKTFVLFEICYIQNLTFEINLI